MCRTEYENPTRLCLPTGIALLLIVPVILCAFFVVQNGILTHEHQVVVQHALASVVRIVVQPILDAREICGK